MLMLMENPLVWSFGLYILYVLLPIVPAAVIFRMFPDTKVAVSGPLQHLSFKAGGAFAGYVVTVVLGFILVNNIELQINYLRQHQSYGVIVGLSKDQLIYSDQLLWRCSPPDASFGWKTCHYVVPLDHPLINGEEVRFSVWEAAPSGSGPPPPTTTLTLQLTPPETDAHRWRVQMKDGRPTLERDGALRRVANAVTSY